MGRHGMVARLAWMACGAVALVAVLAVSGQIPTGLAAQCEIRPRFRVLAEALPELIGNCVASEALNGETGDIEQPVDGGVLVLRSADNTPVFTDGWQTWVAGPNGIETRLNSERLAWEPGEQNVKVWNLRSINLGDISVGHFPKIRRICLLGILIPFGGENTFTPHGLKGQAGTTNAGE